MTEAQNKQVEDKEEPEATFDDQVQYFARKFTWDAHDIAEAYKGKPESLKAHFDAARDVGNEAGLVVAALAMVNLSAGLAAPWALAVTLPVSAGVMYLCVKHDTGQLQDIANAVNQDVEAFRAAKPQPAPQAPG